MSGASPETTVITGQKFVINGRQYDSVEQMTPEDRRHYEKIQSLLSNPSKPPVRIQFDPLNPAEWTPNRGLLATDPTTILFVVMVLAIFAFFGLIAVMGGLRWLLPG